MSLGHEHGFVLVGLAGPMDVVNLSLSLGPSCEGSFPVTKLLVKCPFSGESVLRANSAGQSSPRHNAGSQFSGHVGSQHCSTGKCADEHVTPPMLLMDDGRHERR